MSPIQYQFTRETLIKLARRESEYKWYRRTESLMLVMFYYPSVGNISKCDNPTVCDIHLSVERHQSERQDSIAAILVKLGPLCARQGLFPRYQAVQVDDDRIITSATVVMPLPPRKIIVPAHHVRKVSCLHRRNVFTIV
jgi:hypothetical protein